MAEKDPQPGMTPDPPKGEPSGAIDPTAMAAKYEHIDKQRVSKIEKLEKQIADRDAKLKEAEDAKKTEHEKAIETAMAKAAAESDAKWEAKFTGQAIDHALAGELTSRRYDKDFALLVKASGEVGSADDVKDAVDGWLKAKGWPEKAASGARVPGVPPGGPDPPSKKDSGVWDAARITGATSEDINANWDKIRLHNPGR